MQKEGMKQDNQNKEEHGIFIKNSMGSFEY